MRTCSKSNQWQGKTMAPGLHTAWRNTVQAQLRQESMGQVPAELKGQQGERAGSQAEKTAGCGR